MQGELFSKSEPVDPREGWQQQRDRAIQKVSQHAEEHRPGFAEEARAFIVTYLQTHGPTSGEVLTLACKAAGISGHDDRCFGGIYMGLSRRGVIEKVGSVKRERGHGASGGNVWGLAR